MSEATSVCERSLANAALEELGQALHDLCQPLTTLQCRLEVAGVVGTMEAYQEAVDAGLAECSRLVESVASMREILRAARPAGEETSQGSG
jgi:hypothetical protein